MLKMQKNSQWATTFRRRQMTWAMSTCLQPSTEVSALLHYHTSNMSQYFTTSMSPAVLYGIITQCECRDSFYHHTSYGLKNPQWQLPQKINTDSFKGPILASRIGYIAECITVENMSVQQKVQRLCFKMTGMFILSYWKMHNMTIHWLITNAQITSQQVLHHSDLQWSKWNTGTVY